jgi:hypothetical protein
MEPADLLYGVFVTYLGGSAMAFFIYALFRIFRNREN